MHTRPAITSHVFGGEPRRHFVFLVLIFFVFLIISRVVLSIASGMSLSIGNNHENNQKDVTMLQLLMEINGNTRDRDQQHKNHRWKWGYLLCDNIKELMEDALLRSNRYNDSSFEYVDMPMNTPSAHRIALFPPAKYVNVGNNCEDNLDKSNCNDGMYYLFDLDGGHWDDSLHTMFQLGLEPGDPDNNVVQDDNDDDKELHQKPNLSLSNPIYSNASATWQRFWRRYARLPHRIGLIPRPRQHEKDEVDRGSNRESRRKIRRRLQDSLPAQDEPLHHDELPVVLALRITNVVIDALLLETQAIEDSEDSVNHRHLRSQNESEIPELRQLVGSRSHQDYSLLQPFQRDGFYRITIDEQGRVSLFATHLIGLRHAFISVLQLLVSVVPCPLPITIEDWPTNQYRGMLVDVARHFQPIPLLKRCIDALEASKLNVLHLHLTDSQSFPILFEDVPRKQTPINSFESNITDPTINPLVLELSKLGMNGSFCKDKLYTLAELRELVQYGADRGVELIPEIDMPAHAWSWGRAFPGIIVDCKRTASSAQTPHNIYPLDPSNPLTLEIAEAILIQISSVFISPYLHVGGDEVEISCWSESESLHAWAQSKQWTMRDVFADFEFKIFRIVRTLGKVPMVWQGVLDTGAMPNGDNRSLPAVVEPWKCWSGLAVRAGAKAAVSGHRVVMASCWYIDYDQEWTSYLVTDPISDARSAAAVDVDRARASGHKRRLDGESDIIPGQETIDNLLFPGHGLFTSSAAEAEAIELHPVRRLLEQQQRQQQQQFREDAFLGGSGAMWNERVDFTNLECRMWPRIGAVAARLWGVETWQLSSRLHQGDVRSQSLGILPVNTTRNLLISFVTYRELLVQAMRVDAAEITLHYRVNGQTRGSSASSQSRSSSYSIQLHPLTVHLLAAAVSRIVAANNQLSLTHSAKNLPLCEGCFQLTATCMGIPEIIQRPVTIPRVSVAQLNVEVGSTGQRGTKMLEWLQRKATIGVIAVGFCELNGWQELKDSSNAVDNFPMMRIRAANAGFTYSHLFKSSQPYNIGIVSALPLIVLGEYGPPIFQRGVLHVFIPKASLHILVVHLHAHSSAQRELEVQYIGSQIIAGIHHRFGDDAHIIVMGDLNTLSRIDAEQHKHDNLVPFILRKDHQVFDRFRQKYLTADKSEINYRPLDLLSSFELYDSCAVTCGLLTNQPMNFDSSSPLNFPSWSSTDNSEYSQCMRVQCPGTEPTDRNTEWPTLSDNAPHPTIRLDYIYISRSILRGSQKRHQSLDAGISSKTTGQSNPATAFASATSQLNELDVCVVNPEQDGMHSTVIRHVDGHVLKDPLFPPPNSMVQARWMSHGKPFLYAGIENSSDTRGLSDHLPVFASWLTHRAHLY